MNKYPQSDSWCIVEEGFNASVQLDSENDFSLANGHIGQYGNFEEYYSGKSRTDSYISGVCYPEFTKVEKGDNSFINQNNQFLNVPNWTGIIVRLNDEVLDLATWELQSFRRVLNMREGFLERSFEITSPKGHHIQVFVKRFLSLAEKEVCAISYSIKSLNFDGRISFMPIIDGDIKVQNDDNNEQLWSILQIKTQQDVSHLWAHARRMNFQFCGALTYVLYKNNEQLKINPTKIEKERVVGFSVGTDVKSGDTLCLNKYVAIIDSLSHLINDLPEYACLIATNAKKKGWNKLLEEHSAVWAEKWLELMRVDEEKSVEAQQVIYHKVFNKIIQL